MNQLRDQEIISKIVAGSHYAYALLVDRYQNRIFTLAYQILLNGEVAEAAAQDAFVKAFKGLAGIRSQSLFRHVLHRICF